MTRLIVLVTLLATGITVAAAFQAPAAMVVDVEKLKDNLYLMKGGGGNSAVFITSTGVTVVDTKLPGWGKPLLDKIKTVTDKPITTVINTHSHFDHVSGNVEFPANVEVITHENTRTFMDQANPVYPVQTGPQTNIFKQHGGHGMPKRTFKDKMTIGSGADQIDLYHYGRAHTGGDAYVVFRALRVMHAGDTFPRLDLPIMDKNNGGSGVDFPATLRKALTTPDVDTVITGHYNAMTPADLRLYSEFVGDFVKFVQDGKKAGKSVDEVVSAWKVPAKYTGYAQDNPQLEKADAELIFSETR